VGVPAVGTDDAAGDGESETVTASLGGAGSVTAFEPFERPRQKAAVEPGAAVGHLDHRHRPGGAALRAQPDGDPAARRRVRQRVVEQVPHGLPDAEPVDVEDRLVRRVHVDVHVGARPHRDRRFVHQQLAHRGRRQVEQLMTLLGAGQQEQLLGEADEAVGLHHSEPDRLLQLVQ
jgi:hypothetical protein